MIAGLPAHPMIVHFTVVLLVLVPGAVLLSMVWRSLRARLDWLLPVGAVATGIFGLLAERTGDMLMTERGLGVLPAVQAHETFGIWAQRVSLLLAATVVLWWLSSTEQPPRFADRPLLRDRTPRVVLTVLAALASVAGLVLAVATGHSGAVAVWGG